MPLRRVRWHAVRRELLGFGVGGNVFGLDFNLAPSTPEFPQKMVGDVFGLLSGVFYGASMFFNGYRKDADTTARGVYNFIFAVIGAGVIAILMNVVGMATGQTNWITEIHFTTFNWVGAVLLWIVCGPIALGCLLVAGRNLPAMDYSTIAYWEVPVALFIGLVVFSEPVTLNTAIGIILIVGGGAFPTVKAMIQVPRWRSSSKLLRICLNVLPKRLPRRRSASIRQRLT